MAERSSDLVDHPPHYKRGGIECIDVIEAWDLGYHLGNALKYISRAGHKGDALTDLKKAEWYLKREIERIEKSAKPLVDPTAIDIRGYYCANCTRQDILADGLCGLCHPGRFWRP